MHASYKLYRAYIEEKNKSSERLYKTVFDAKASSELFLIAYETMNVYPTYPRPVVCRLKKPKDSYAPGEVDQGGKSTDALMRQLEPMSALVTEKVAEYATYTRDIAKTRNMDKVRRFFDYEIRDHVKEQLPDSKVTNAWVKMYELLKTFDLLAPNKPAHTFHVCEHPGAFIFAVQEFAKRHGIEHSYAFQSLRPGKDRQVFPPDRSLPTAALDYGATGTGDITDPRNIRHYIDKWRPAKPALVTSDCGLDCSDDFNGQEDKMLPIFFAALVAALGVSSTGSHYVFKLFSFSSPATLAMLQVACRYYKHVDIVRLLTDKGGSGEVYVVCRDLVVEPTRQEVEALIDRLASRDFTKGATFHPAFAKRVIKAHEVLSMRRIVSLNQLIFRVRNFAYADQNPDVKRYVQHYVNYYVKYLMTYLALDERRDGRLGTY